MSKIAGFEEIPHTADWALRVWAPAKNALYAQAAFGMQSLMGVTPGEGPREERTIRLQGADPESRLVSFLSEVLYIIENERLAFEAISFKKTDVLEARLIGSRCGMPAKIIKAVTFHNLKIRKTARGYEVELVFDV